MIKLKLLRLAKILWPLMVIAYGFVILGCIIRTWGMGEIPTFIVGIMTIGMLWLAGEAGECFIQDEIDYCDVVTDGTSKTPKGIVNKQTEHNSKNQKVVVSAQTGGMKKYF